jgi:hypothetical protein
MFSLYPFYYLFAIAGIGLAYLAWFLRQKSRTGAWQHRTYRFRLAVAIVGFTVLFWGAITLFTDVRREHVFRARYEPFNINGDPRRVAFRFHYIDYPGSSETVDLDDLRRYLETSRPAEVRLTLETTWDFGALRGYSLEKVDHIRVNEGWSNGHPPWDVLRQGGGSR